MVCRRQFDFVTLVPMLAQSLFILLAVVSLVASLGMLISRNPVTSALWLILTLFCVAGLYLTLNAQFIAVIQILVYAGAIMVLFLFVIMLLNLAALPRLGAVDWKKAVGFVLGTAILAQLISVIVTSAESPAVELSQTGTAVEIAKELFIRYALAFEVIGVLLLVATVGAVMLAQRKFV